ncbi:hypothetical protein YC2023_093377 [Brassica napus]
MEAFIASSDHSSLFPQPPLQERLQGLIEGAMRKLHDFVGEEEMTKKTEPNKEEEMLLSWKRISSLDLYFYFTASTLLNQTISRFEQPLSLAINSGRNTLSPRLKSCDFTVSSFAAHLRRLSRRRNPQPILASALPFLMSKKKRQKHTSSPGGASSARNSSGSSSPPSSTSTKSEMKKQKSTGSSANSAQQINDIVAPGMESSILEKTVALDSEIQTTEKVYPDKINDLAAPVMES